MASRDGIRAAITVLVALLGNACGSAATAPSRQDPLRFDAQITQSRLAPGDTATATFTLRNVSSQTITLGFSSTCQILPQVADRRTQQVVYPRGGWVCAAMITRLVLAPGESSTQQLQVRAAAAANYPFVALPPGDYETYAQVDASRDNGAFSLRSAPLQFVVQ